MLPLCVRALGVQHRFDYLFDRLLLALLLFLVLSLVFRLVRELRGNRSLEDGLGLGGLGASLFSDLRVDKVINEKFLQGVVSITMVDLVESLREGRDDLLAELLYFDFADLLEQDLRPLLNILRGGLDILA